MPVTFSFPSTFEEATSIWNNLGRKVAHAHLRRAQLVYAILNEPDPNKYGRDWSAEDLGKEWGVSGERIRRYVRTVKVFGDELEGLLSLAGISWTHLEEVSRLPNPQMRESVLQEIQTEGFSSNVARERVAKRLGHKAGAPQLVSLPILQATVHTVQVPTTEPATFLTVMERWTGWAISAAAGVRDIGAQVGPHGLFATGVEDQMAASGARNALDDLRDALLEIRPLLNHSIPLPEPKVPISVPAEPSPEASVGRVLEL